jgi:two-component system response regulator AtoC
VSARRGDESPETTQVASHERVDLPRALVVMHGPDVLRCPLPPSGVIVIGRSRDCDVTIDDRSVSRQHARLHIGRELAVEDLGSSNGTLVGGQVIRPRTLTAVRIDEVLRFGVVAALIQRISSASSLAVTTAARLRASLAGRPVAGALAAVRLVLERPAPPEAVATLVRAVLREGDLAAQPEPSIVEVAIYATSAETVEALLTRLVTVCREQLSDCQVATRLVPRDGTDPVALLDEAARSLSPVTALAEGVVVQSPAMRALYGLADQVAEGDLSVLVTGETGVGKEHLAEHIHRASGRSQQPFVRINCAAFAESLFEAEFFGYERGAFTGANQAKAGLLEHAGRGTVFLDEVGELPLPAQAKFLRVLQDRQLMRVGSLTPRPVHARFVAATNRALEREVERGAFRKDLYFRLAGVVLQIPSLRERTGEILPLAERFVAQAAHALGRSTAPAISTASARALIAHGWDGNVRELRNVIERAVLLCRGAVIEPPHLLLPTVDPTLTPPPIPGLGNQAIAPPPPGAPAPGSEQHERLLSALEQTGGNKKEAARLLGISRQTIGKWIDKFGVARPRRTRE